jgi:menaquinone-9 beta-reductase
VVVGAGPSGVATALTLSRAGHSVTVLDRGHFPRDKACGEGLLPPGVAALRRLGVIADVLATGAPQINGVSYRHAGAGPEAYAAFPAPPGGGEPWGLGVRRTQFDAALVEALRRDSRVTLLEGVRATGLVRHGSGAVAGVTTARDTVAADVVIAADGLHSAVRAAAGLTRAATGRPRYGLAGHWALDVRDVDRIRVTFCDEQEWYECPVGPDLLLVSTLADRSRIGDTSHRYASAARAALPGLRDAELVGRPLAAGLFRQRPRAVAAGGVFLVGDAAGYDDPTTGEGIGIGLLLGERVGFWVAAQLSGQVDRARAQAGYRRDHATLRRNRSRVTALALTMAGRPWLSHRAVAGAADRPAALSALLGVNCGYWGFGKLTMRDWLTLAGF